ncbi:hypothetical protein AVEN_120023-1 [Araneus ventricosus]|uniref:Uncharacterized protein n=1 Tax=Araneus ventricosus TaxID=182803 RepID=A0A4Y2AMP2_ARAVE|nr:hypothetical protein AVEN_95453-1 [Araneus ventricosus]GBL81184.1 hypothetical protein AVEN_120023-1 [Araneus ventricosus]
MPLKVEQNKLTVATLDTAQMRNAALILESEALVASMRTILRGFASIILESLISHSSGVSPFQTVVISGGTLFQTVVSSDGTPFRAGLPWLLQTVEVRTISGFSKIVEIRKLSWSLQSTGST